MSRLAEMYGITEGLGGAASSMLEDMLEAEYRKLEDYTEATKAGEIARVLDEIGAANGIRGDFFRRLARDWQMWGKS